jgi:hypothetical protein
MHARTETTCKHTTGAIMHACVCLLIDPMVFVYVTLLAWLVACHYCVSTAHVCIIVGWRLHNDAKADI